MNETNNLDRPSRPEREGFTWASTRTRRRCTPRGRNASARDGNTHWAQAKNGEGGYHYTQARFCYGEAAKNAAKAEQARADNAVFRCGRKKGGR